MTIRYLTTTIGCLLFYAGTFGQDTQTETTYHRSSLHNVLIESNHFDNEINRAIVTKAWNDYLFPERYNNLDLNDRILKPDAFEIAENMVLDTIVQDTSTEKESIVSGMTGKLQNHLKNKVDNTIPDPTKGIEIFEQDKEEVPKYIEHYLKKTDLARKIVARWFNIREDGNFDMNYVGNMGVYDVSELDKALSAKTVRESSLLKDAGMELVNKTFVTFSKLFYLKNEPLALMVKEAAKKKANEQDNEAKKLSMIASAEAAYQKGKEGYSVWTTTWLYRLVWNDSVQDVFFGQIWGNKTAFDTTGLFKLELVGTSAARSLVTAELRGHLKEGDYIRRATHRNIDAIYASLQRKYETFRPMIPVTAVDPIRARVGLKESIEQGSRFEVLEMRLNRGTNRTEYKRIGVATVNKSQAVWDNRFYLEGEQKEVQSDKDGNPLPPVDITAFTGAKKTKPGMLLRLLR